MKSILPVTLSDGAKETVSSNNLTIDPKFADPEGLDFHLKPGSPAIDAGTEVVLTRDWNDKVVPLSRAPDIGAYEYGA